jgi:hypothetical protein
MRWLGKGCRLSITIVMSITIAMIFYSVNQNVTFAVIMDIKLQFVDQGILCQI